MDSFPPALSSDSPSPPLPEKAAFNRALLAWFDREKRDLPWRQERTAYKVLVSELMLQQTQVTTVLPYYEKFMKKWPQIEDLAEAGEDEVREAWAGLGYYQRAENLVRCAREALMFHDGKLPRDLEALKKLPGIGAYTAAAIASMAFGLAEPSIDGNLLRVLARVSKTAWQAGREKDKKEALAYARQLIDEKRPGDWNEALMDLASSLCLPGSCGQKACPLAEFCLAGRDQTFPDYPLKARETKKLSESFSYLILRKQDSLYLVPRKERLLHQFSEFIRVAEIVHKAELQTKSGERISCVKVGEMKRVFSHRIWNFSLYSARIDAMPEDLQLIADENKPLSLPSDGSFVEPCEARKALIPFLAAFAEEAALL